MYRTLTPERLLAKVSEVFGHADFLAIEVMLARVHLTTSGNTISEESYETLKEFFGAGLAQLPEEMPFRRYADKERVQGFRVMRTWLDTFWHRAISNDFGDIFIFCDACYEKRSDKELFFWFLADEMCDACGQCTHEDRCLHCGEATRSYSRYAVPHFGGKIGYGVEWNKFLGIRDIPVCTKCLGWGWPTMAVGDQVEFREKGTAHYPSLDPTKPRPTSFLEVKEVIPLEDALTELVICKRCKREIKSDEVCVRNGKAFTHQGDCPAPAGEGGTP